MKTVFKWTFKPSNFLNVKVKCNFIISQTECFECSLNVLKQFTKKV